MSINFTEYCRVQQAPDIVFFWQSDREMKLFTFPPHPENKKVILDLSIVHEKCFQLKKKVRLLNNVFYVN